MPAAIYARQSIEKADSVSIDAQIERCRAICEQNSWDYCIYTDIGFSGKNINRPNFERLLADIKAGKICALVSYKLDRISRSITDFAQLLQLFEKYGVQYISSTEQFDTSSPVGRAMIYIVMVFAQLERETITQRVTDNYRYRASKGLYMGGNTPLGYRSQYISLDGRRASILAVDEHSAPTVREIFLLYQSGCNTHQLARRLNAAGTVTSKGKLFTASAVLRILRNITYSSNTPELYEYLAGRNETVLCGVKGFDGRHGMCCYFKKNGSNGYTPQEMRLITPGRHQAIVDAQQWIAVQNRLDTANTGIRSARSSSRSWLAGLLKCAACGHAFGLKYTKKASGEYAYYFCRGRSARGTGSCPNDLWLNAGELEKALESRILSHVKALLAPCECMRQSPCDADAALIKLRSERIECKTRIQNLMNGIGKGNTVVDRHLTESITELDGQYRSLEKEIARQTAKNTQANEKEPCAPNLMEEIKALPLYFTNADIDSKRCVARALVKEITVSRGGTVTVDWSV